MTVLLLVKYCLHTLANWNIFLKNNLYLLIHYTLHHIESYIVMFMLRLPCGGQELMKLLVLHSIDSYSWLDTMMRANFDEQITSNILDVSDCRMNSESLYCGCLWNSFIKGGSFCTPLCRWDQ